MLKIIGCLFVIFSSVFCATNYCSGLKRRINGISFFIRSLELFKIKMEYEKSTIVQIIEGLSNECDYQGFLDCCFKNIRIGYSLKTAWNKSLNEKIDKLGLTKDDVVLLEKFCQELGETDLDGQISNISLYIELLSKNLEELEKTVKDKSRVAINTGVFAGLIVSILLI